MDDSTQKPTIPVTEPQAQLEIIPFDEIEYDDEVKMDSALNFIEPLFRKALEELGEGASKVSTKSWLLRRQAESKFVIPDFFGQGEVAMDELAAELSFWLGDQDLFKGLKKQIADGFEEIIETVGYDNMDELVSSLVFFTSLVEPMVREQGIGLTSLQIYQFRKWRDMLHDVSSYLSDHRNEPDPVKAIITVAEFRGVIND